MITKAKKIVFSAGEILVEKFQTGFVIENKSRSDLVTDADRHVEKYIVDQINQIFPSHSICGEEGGLIRRSDHSIWFIDPIDGTTNFAHGLPYFSISLAFAQAGEIVLGIVYNPLLKDFFIAEKGAGSFLNDQKIEVSKETDLQNCLFATCFPNDITASEHDNMPAFQNIYRASLGVRNLGSAALDLCQVACGRLDGLWGKGLKPWDMAAGSLIVTEAGGTVSRYGDSSFSYYEDEIVASNGLIHNEFQLFFLPDRGSSRSGLKLQSD